MVSGASVFEKCGIKSSVFINTVTQVYNCNLFPSFTAKSRWTD